MGKRWLTWLALFLVILLILPACGGGDEPVLTLTLPSDTPPETVQLIRETAPALEQHLPGLLKYQNSMSFDGVEAHIYSPSQDSGLPPNIAVTWLKFVVAQDGGSIPNAYRAWGHHLRIGIAETGDALILQKTEAKSVFLDKPAKNTGQDMVIKI
jgi:hypothetical protein